MQHSEKVVLNIIASFSRVIINAVVTLIATRVALRVLGASDYGLYNLLAGTVALLSFVNGALIISAQRYFSVAIGAKDESRLCKYFKASISIHVLIGLFIVFLLFAIKGFLFSHLLNIDSEQIDIGKSIYDIMIISSAFTIMTIPFSAVINAHEDLVLLAIADIASCLVKLFAALILLVVNHDFLLIYSIIMLSAVVLKAVIEYIWSIIHYSEVKNNHSKLFDIPVMREMLGFVGWNTLGSLAVVVRNQGAAIVLNVFFGTIINTAYGIANQVNSLVLSFATTLTSVFAPVIIQAKGSGNETRMRQVAIFSSKISFFLSSIMALPIFVFMKSILDIWLGEYPDSTFIFCFLIVLSFIVLQLYPGVNRAIYASGHIKGYQISLSVLLVSILPIGVVLFKLGLPPYSIIVIMLISQIGTLFATIFYGVRHCGYEYKDLFINIVLKPLSCFVLFFVLSFIVRLYFIDTILLSCSSDGLTLLVVLASAVAFALPYTFAYYLLVLNDDEKGMVRRLAISLLRKYHNHDN